MHQEPNEDVSTILPLQSQSFGLIIKQEDFKNEMTIFCSTIGNGQN